MAAFKSPDRREPDQRLVCQPTFAAKTVKFQSICKACRGKIDHFKSR